MIPFENSSDAFAGLAHIGLMARNVEDIITTLPIVAGGHSHDPHSLNRSVKHADGICCARSLEGLRIGWREKLSSERLSDNIRRSTLSALNVLQDMGAIVEVITGEIEHPLPIWQVLQHVSWSMRYAQRDPRLPQIDPVIASGLEHAKALSARDLQAAPNGKTLLFRQVQCWFDRFDIVVTPTLTRGPLAAAHPGSGDIDVDGQPSGDIRAAWAPLLGLFTMTGHPAISLNCGWTMEQLPIGLQMVGKWHHDYLLLEVARSLQARLTNANWHMPRDFV